MKKLLLTSFLLFGFFIVIYPLKKEDINLIDYCYSLEKIISRNSVEKSKNLPKNFKNFAKNFREFGTNKTKGNLVKKIIERYKNSKKLFIINSIPNQIICLAGYWIEEIKPGRFQSILYEKSEQKVNEFKDIKKEVDELINDINSEYKSIKKDINNFF